MAILYKDKRIPSGAIVTPHEVNTELRNVVGEMNGFIDRDNIDRSVITSDKIKQGAITKLAFQAAATTLDIVVSSKLYGTPQIIPGVLAGSTLEDNVTTGDGFLVIAAGVMLEERTVVTRNCCLAILVDDILVAMAGPSGTTNAAGQFISPHLRCYVPVGAGPHNVKPILFVSDAGTYRTESRHLFIRYGVR